MKKIKMDKT